MRQIVETLLGIWALLVLACKTRCRLRGAYWRWRTETAFGHAPSRHLSCRERIRAVLEYGRWVHRMKRATK